MAQQRYHVIERIDAGGMAEVFKANASSLQGFEKLVAIKRILPELTRNERFVRMFLDEAKVSLHLNHTNCVQVFDLGLADGTYFIVMEFVDGTNLKNIIEWLKTSGQSLRIEETAFIALEICKGLSHAHNKKDQSQNHLGIVHRDISPPNVLMSVEGEVKITDFGLAKAKSQVETTDPGIVKGKFGYLSPEAAYGETVDARTDVFAVGIMMWEMLTGERLFLGNTDIETLQQVRANKTPPLGKYRSDVPAAYEAIIRKALETDINKRYQTTEELGMAIAGFMYSYGKPITNYQLARYVRAVKSQSAGKQRTEKDRAIEEAIQQAVNRIVSLEEVDDLDLYLAEKFGGIENDAGGVWDGDGDFEDPRDWADFGMDDVAVREAGHTGDDWHSKNLDEIMRQRQTMPGGHPAPPRATAPPIQDQEDKTSEINPAIVSSILKEQRRPGEDVPLHERPAPAVAPRVEPPAARSSIEVDASFGQQAQFVPAAPRRADNTSEMPAYVAPAEKKAGPPMALKAAIAVLVLVILIGALFLIM